MTHQLINANRLLRGTFTGETGMLFFVFDLADDETFLVLLIHSVDKTFAVL